MKVYESVDQLVGHTPLLELKRVEEAHGVSARILGKLEYFNPAGSIKDRIAKAMIDDAEAAGILKPGATIIEPTSGNTGIGLASIAAARGYQLILTMPETMSVERRNLIKAYGAKIVLTDGAKGMTGAIEKANELAAEIEGSFIPGQFINPANPAIHKATTGPEDLAGHQMAPWTSWSLVLVREARSRASAKYLKEQNPEVKLVAVEPSDSPVLSEGRAGSHKIQGIGAGFVPEVLDTTL